MGSGTIRTCSACGHSETVLNGFGFSGVEMCDRWCPRCKLRQSLGWGHLDDPEPDREQFPLTCSECDGETTDYTGEEEGAWNEICPKCGHEDPDHGSGLRLLGTILWD